MFEILEGAEEAVVGNPFPSLLPDVLCGTVWPSSCLLIKGPFGVFFGARGTGDDRILGQTPQKWQDRGTIPTGTERDLDDSWGSGDKGET